MTVKARLGLAITVAGLIGCGGSSPPPGGGNDSGASVDAATPRYPTHDCVDTDFVDRSSGGDETRVITATAENTYDVPCITIAAGQSVTWMTDFTMHPLGVGVAPGHLGESTTPTPIEPQTTGASYTAAFSAAGEYAFYCTTHYHHTGMYGVVRVVP